MYSQEIFSELFQRQFLDSTKCIDKIPFTVNLIMLTIKMCNIARQIRISLYTLIVYQKRSSEIIMKRIIMRVLRRLIDDSPSDIILVKVKLLYSYYYYYYYHIEIPNGKIYIIYFRYTIDDQSSFTFSYIITKLNEKLSGSIILSWIYYQVYYYDNYIIHTHTTLF